MAIRMISAKKSAIIKDVLVCDPGVKAGHYRFGDATLARGRMARPATINNASGQTIYVLLNPAGATPEASTTVYDFKIADGGYKDLSMGGLIGVVDVSIWLPATGTEANINTRGWDGP